MDAEQTVAKLNEKFPGLFKAPVLFRGETTVFLQDNTKIVEIAQFMKALGFDYLVDLSGADHFGEEPRFEVIYGFYSYKFFKHFRIKTRVSEDFLQVPSIAGVYQTANWHEREAYDMFGIHFGGHPDLRRILMWDGYPYFPLRKDFPLEGRPSELPGEGERFSGVAPLAGGPFVAPTSGLRSEREPRSREPNPDERKLTVPQAVQAAQAAKSGD